MDKGIISINGERVVITPAIDGANSSGTVWMSKHQIAELFGCFVAKVVSNIAVILKMACSMRAGCAAFTATRMAAVWNSITWR
jgi:hypothetical protein